MSGRVTNKMSPSLVGGEDSNAEVAEFAFDLYCAFREAGFNEAQAFSLVETLMAREAYA